MLAVLIGGSGFLGSYVKSELLQNGLKCYSAGRSESNDLILDILDVSSLGKLFLGIKPDIVLNFAGAFSKNDESGLRVNSEGPKCLIDSLLPLSDKPRVIHIASATEPRIGTRGGVKFESKYSESKFIGTNVIRLAGERGDIDARIVRVHNCYGKGQPADRFISWATSKLMSGEEISIKYPDRIRDFCLVDEAAQRICEIATSEKKSSELNCVEVGTGLGLSLKTVAVKICETLNVEKSLVTVLDPDLEDPHPYEVARTQESILGKCAIEFHVGIQETLRGL
jgi:nucleoside-diphosphate-sugar epimerase